MKLVSPSLVFTLLFGFGHLPDIPAAESPKAGMENWEVRGSDPTELISRLEVRNEYLSLPGDGYLDQVYLRGDFAPSEDLVFKLEVPLADGHREGLGSHFGVGDLILGGRGKLLLEESLSWVLGTDFILHTATRNVLGSGWNQIAPVTTLVFKPTRQWIFSVFYQYVGSFGNSGQEKISESLFRPGVLYNFRDGYWFWLDPRVYINHEQGNVAGLFLEGEFGKVVTPHVEVWLRGGGNTAGSGREERLGWKAEAGIRDLFH